MSSVIKFLIVLVIAGGLGWLAWSNGLITKFTKPQTTATVQTNEQASTTPTAPEPQNTNGMSAQTDTSEAAIAQDVAAIEVMMKGLATDSADIDASLADKPITQSY